MKKILFIPLIAFFVACSSTPKTASEINLTDFEQRISYALGADMGANFTNVPDEIFSLLNPAELERGFYEFLKQEELQTVECLEILEMALSNHTGIDTSTYNMNEVSHCYGAIFGEMMRKSLVSKNAMDKIKPEIARIGFAEALAGSDTLIEIGERQEMIMNFNNDLN